MYTRANSVKQAELKDLTYNMIRAKVQNSDHKLRYPAECKEAGNANPTYTELKLRIKKKWVDRAQRRKDRIERKNR